MPSERFYSKFPLLANQTIALKDQEFHHLVNVMRASKGDFIELIDGKGSLAEASVETINKHQATLYVHKVTVFPPPSLKIILAQAIPRLPRIDFILEKGTELGMTDLWLFPGEKSEKKLLNDHQVERMQSIMISALKQSGRVYLPIIQLKPKLLEWGSLSIPLYYGDVTSDAIPLIQVFSHPCKELIFCIGPESGFTREETRKLLSLGGKGVKLNEFTLRTDTAALCALSLITHLTHLD
jgi:16S rRNA (uracil1498-N3)-methyltransferase